LRFAEAQSEDRDRRQIERNDRQVERIEPVDSTLRLTFHVSRFTFQAKAGTTSSWPDGRRRAPGHMIIAAQRET
jgi:hypothetical protein